ncbi:MAG TPA: hypothetical protein VHW44_24205 [Pseudonocardiaceae bacterium]|jgi:hypothetical protein|nr:hypothetical protein [Pseudonocardiaceae bacterium]
MIALIVFGVILLVCAEEVIRLARDARADMDDAETESDTAVDVFTRRRDSARAMVRRGWQLLRAGRTAIGESATTASVNVAVIRRQRQMDRPTVRLPRPNRDLATMPAIVRN